VSRGSANQAVVSCREHVGPALLGACQMQSVEGAGPKLLKERGALSRAWLWDMVGNPASLSE
jgi:hypothetical protein